MESSIFEFKVFLLSTFSNFTVFGSTYQTAIILGTWMPLRSSVIQQWLLNPGFIPTGWS